MKQTKTNIWNDIFKKYGKFFINPHEDMHKIVPILKERAHKRILDLGCGTGRHIIYLAKRGFNVFGLDNSPKALSVASRWVKDEGVEAVFTSGDMKDPLPFENNFLDAVISIQVIHHAGITTIKSIIREIKRVLRRDGLLFITVPKYKNQAAKFKMIEPRTFIPLDGEEKGLPHHYFTPDELHILLYGFYISDIHMDTQKHYCVTAFKR
ncbi:MAG: class I SAM-dependent methyltransferase [Spirochaetales bacterium]|nr:class I SAM-dependent methyltransferase [Spirochaetales bacterium]